MAETPKLRGSIVLDQLDYIEALYGREVIDKGLASISEEFRSELRHVLPITWLSADAAQALKDAIAEQVGIESITFNRQVVRQSIGKTMHSLWRALLRQLWDGAIIKRTPILYSKAFDRGEMSLSFSGDKSATFSLRGWPDIPAYNCAGLAEGIEAVLEFSGRTKASVKWRKSGDLMLFDATWR